MRGLTLPLGSGDLISIRQNGRDYPVSASDLPSAPARVNRISDLAYTLKDTDNGKTLVFAAAADVALTVPAGLGTGFQCALVQGGAGQVTVSAGAGAAVSNRQGQTKTAGQYAVMSLLAIAPDNYALAGDGA